MTIDKEKPKKMRTKRNQRTNKAFSEQQFFLVVLFAKNFDSSVLQNSNFVPTTA